ncbi:MAG: T9SS type A sorting domain-containing protein [Bacteroidetes bacterium]|nr:T9SS type A sorting domain-containing protein [Bacteroidota bacterium]
MGKIKTYTFKVLVFCCILCGWMTLPAQILSDFTASDETWKVYNEPSGGAPGLPINWSATGGNPGGYVFETDISVGAWGWMGPTEFKGDLSAYYDCYLSFDLYQTSHLGIMTNYYDVMIFNTTGDTMVYNYTDPVVINTWLNYIITLNDAAGWKYGSSIAGAAPAATAAQMLAILSDVSKIRIRAEYSGLTYETNGIDNVLISCALLLPVELLEFKAEVAGERVAKLTWSTASENNCNGFQVEKSVNFTEFDSIGFIPGNGTTPFTHTYDFYDNNFNTSAYYRIREVNFEGRKFSSDIVYLKNENSNIVTTMVYPNPTSDNIVIIADDVNPVLQYIITDCEGRTLLEAPVESYTGLFKKSISMAKFPSGIYTVTFIKEQGSDTQLFTLAK